LEEIRESLEKHGALIEPYTIDVPYRRVIPSLYVSDYADNRKFTRAKVAAVLHLDEAKAGRRIERAVKD
jgi:hypothetical protein